MTKILIVDDERSIRLTLAKFLDCTGYEVAVAEDAQEAEAMLGGQSFDVVLTDIILPRVTGVELLRRIKAKTPGTLVIMMTGDPRVETAVEAVRAGAYDYLTKPISKDAVLCIVARAAQVQELQHETRRLAAANLDYQAGLERKVAERTEALQAAHDELERRVEERTAELRLANAKLAREIGEHEQTEAELRHSQTLITSVFDSIQGHIAVLDQTGVILTVNEAWSRFAGRNGAPLHAVGTGVNYLNVCHQAALAGDPTAQQAEAGIQAVLAATSPEFSLEYRCDAAEARAWMQMHVHPRLPPGSGVIITHHDITALRQAESEIRQRSQEIAHLSRVSMMGELAASLSHELSQPLTAALTNAEAALELLGPGVVDVAELPDIVLEIITESRRARDVILRLRALFKKSPLELQRLDLNQVVRDVLPLVQGDAVAREVPLTLELAPVLPPVRGDRVHLQQVILNLVLNAFAALAAVPKDQRTLIVRTRPDEKGWVQVQVEDSGTGIPADKLETIFASFFTTKPDGIGMGLSLCRTIIESHHGRILARNNPQCGATLQFSLPVPKDMSS